MVQMDTPFFRTLSVVNGHCSRWMWFGE